MSTFIVNLMGNFPISNQKSPFRKNNFYKFLKFRPFLIKLNNLDTPESKINSIDELKDGKLFFVLIHLIFNKTNHLYTIHEEDNTDNNASNDYFTSIKLVIEEKFLIRNGIDYEKARCGNVIELSKICLVILSNGIGFENESIIKSCERLNLELYEIMTNFYFIAEKNKSKFPPNSIELYEKLLLEKNVTSLNDQPMPTLASSSKSSYSSSASFSSTINCRITNLSNEIYSFNDYEDDEAIYSSLKDGIRGGGGGGGMGNARLEEGNFLEKRNYENKLHKKDVYIYELELELDERQEKINFLIKTLNELKRQRTKLNEDLAIEYNMLVKEVEQEKHAKNMLEQKCCQMSFLLAEKNESQLMLEKMNTTLSDQVKFLTRRIEQTNSLKKSEAENVSHKQLQTVESKLKTKVETKSTLLNEKLIVGLLNQYKLLEKCLMNINQKLDILKNDCNDRVDELASQNAMHTNLINSLEAKMACDLLSQKNVINFAKFF